MITKLLRSIAAQDPITHSDDAGTPYKQLAALVNSYQEQARHILANPSVNKATNALQALVEALEEMGIADPDQAMSGADTVDVLCQFYPKLKEALK